MFGEIKRGCSLAGLTLVFGLSGCRGLNPAYDADANHGTSTLPIQESTAGQSTKAPSTQPANPEPGSTGLPTGAGQDGNHARPESLTTTTSSASASSPTNSGSDTSTTYVVPNWNEIEPKPAQNPSAQDLCNRGAKGCFVFDNHAATQVESQTPQYPGFYVTVNNGLAPPPPSANISPPLNTGVRLDSTNSRIESLFPYPRFEGQDFGIEIWYRSDPTPTYSHELVNNSVKPVMLVQVLKHIWLQEDPRNGGIACAMTTSTTEVSVVPHAYQVGPLANQNNQGRPRDQLRVAACAISNSKIYVWSNGVMAPQPPNINYEIGANVLDQKIAFGGWVTGNAAANNFQALQGTIYMVRIWNNINYMRDAMVANLAHHQGSIDDSAISELGITPP